MANTHPIRIECKENPAFIHMLSLTSLVHHDSQTVVSNSCLEYYHVDTLYNFAEKVPELVTVDVGDEVHENFHRTFYRNGESYTVAAIGYNEDAKEMMYPMFDERMLGYDAFQLDAEHDTDLTQDQWS